MTRKSLLSLLLILLVAGADAAARDSSEVAKKKQSKKEQAAAAAAATDDEKKKKDDKKPFEKVVEDMEKVEGLFTFYRDLETGKVLMELAPDQLDRDYIYSGKFEQATGERGLYGTIMMGEFVFQWRRMGERIQFVERNLRFRAAPGSPAERALANSFSDSIKASAKIASKPHDERGSVLIDLSEIFLSGDLHGLGAHLKKIYDTPFKFDKENSGFVMVKSFPLNAELGIATRFTADAVEEPSVTIPDARSLSLRFRYSLLEVPDNDYRPRFADDRIGYFADQHLDYTSVQAETPYVRYINRWHLQKKDPEAELSEPVQPIVFWLENTIPLEYREWVTEGILLWNAAFEKIGFKNALVVEQQPDDADWDPADIRYNTIRWFVGYDASFAIGPSHTNPYTGQIIDADIGFSEGILRLGARRRYSYTIDPVSRLRSMASEEAERERALADDGHRICRYGEQLVEMSSMALDLLSMSPDWSSEEEQDFVRQYVMELAVHEVGHTLGLRHNFRASTIYEFDDLLHADRWPSGAIGASVMDYNPVIVAIGDEDQGDYLPTSVGSYDEWAIEYGYKPITGAAAPEEELEELGAIASRAADPMLPYATDWDASLSARGLDPRTTRFDFGARPLDFYDHEFRLVAELWSRIEGSLLEEGEGYDILRRAFNYSWRPYYSGPRVAAKYIGGVYHSSDHFGDPNGRLPFVPVPAADQRAALEFLADRVWSPEPFEVPAELLQRLQFTRFVDFNLSVVKADRFDYPLHEVVLELQSSVLDELYHPIKLARIQDLELMVAEENEAFTMAELFAGIRSALWSELATGDEIHSFRRNLQHAHLDRLELLVLKPPADTPADAVSLARADLVSLQQAADRALDERPEAATAAHLQAVTARIERALNASLVVGGGGGSGKGKQD